MNRIVIGVDGSDASISAVEWLVNWLGDTPTLIDLVSAHSQLSQLMADRAVRTDLEYAERQLNGWDGLHSVSTHRVSGRPVRVLTELARGADLLVLGADPHHPLRAAFTGWLPVRVCAASPVPVAVIPAGWRPSDDPITVGVDLDGSSRGALQWAAEEAGKTRRRVRLVHAWHLPEPTTDGSIAVLARPEQILAERRNALEAVRHTMAREYPRVALETDLTSARPSAALLSYAPSSSLIVLGSHRLGVLEGGLVGATGADLFWRAGCPIVVVPPTARAEGLSRHNAQR